MNTAPAEMAATTPIIFPMPTLVAVDTTSACRPEIAVPEEPLRFSVIARTISGNMRMGRNRVRTVK